MKLILAKSQKLCWKNFGAFLNKEYRQNSDFQCQKLSESFKKNFIEDQFRAPTFAKKHFDKFNFTNNLFLKLGGKVVNFLNLSTFSEKLQKNFRCNFCNCTSISFSVISFHQFPLTWWNAYPWSPTRPVLVPVSRGHFGVVGCTKGG